CFNEASYTELQQRYPPGSRERHFLAEFLGFFEGPGVLVSRGLLHEDVFFDAPFDFELVWKKVGPILDEWQTAVDDPGRLEGRIPSCLAVLAFWPKAKGRATCTIVASAAHRLTSPLRARVPPVARWSAHRETSSYRESR